MSDDSSLLQLIGLEQASERIYMFVLHRGRASASEAAERFDLPESEAVERLDSLRDLGLVARRTGEDGDYVPVDPRYSLRAISDRMNDGVRRIHEQTPTLADYFDRAIAHHAESPKTQVLSDSDAVAGWYARLQHQVTSEFMAFDRPPYVTASGDPLETVSLARGVSWRAIYAASSFELGGLWDEVEELAVKGEQSRVVPDLPLKLAIADRSIALISLSHESGRVESLVTESGPLVAALCDLFEFYWERAMRIPSERSLGTADAVNLRALQFRDPTLEERSLLALIGAGVKDDVIARQLGMSPRTLRRRSQELMGELGAANRFQAGVEAARRGWV